MATFLTKDSSTWR